MTARAEPAAAAPVPDDNTVLGRSVGLLAAFRPGDNTLSLAEIHRRTGMPKPTAHRLLLQLTGWRLVERSADGYRLGLRLFEIGQLVPRQRGLPETVAPVLTRLHDATGLTVHLAVLDQNEMVYIDKLHANGAPSFPSTVGGRMPVHCTAVGKAVLAYASVAVTGAVLGAGLPRLAPRTIVAPTLLLSQLQEIRRRGFARDEEESAIGVNCIAAPIFDADHRVVAALSVTARTHDVRWTSPIQAVCAAADDATRRLGSDSAAGGVGGGR